MTTWHDHPVICVFSQPRVERQEVNHTILVTKSPDAGSYQIFTSNQHFRIVTKHREPSTQPQHYSTYRTGQNNILRFIYILCCEIFTQCQHLKDNCVFVRYQIPSQSSLRVWPNFLTTLLLDPDVNTWTVCLDQSNCQALSEVQSQNPKGFDWL